MLLAKTIYNGETLAKIKEVLQKVRTLTEAEKLLTKFNLSRAESWGLFDGFRHRDHCLSGLVATDCVRKEDEEKTEQYDNCYTIGIQLRSEQ